MEPIVLKAATIAAAEAYNGKTFEAYLAYIEEETDGKVTFERYFSGSLLSGPDSLEGVSAGVADISQISPTFFPQELPIFTWILQVASLTEEAHPLRKFQLTGAMSEFLMNNEESVQEYHDQGVKMMLPSLITTDGYLCTSQVDTLDAARGKVTRVGGSPWDHEVEALGMSPSFTPVLEIYEALQRGIVNCVTSIPLLSWNDLSLLEVAEHVTFAATNPTGGGHIINLDTWNGLPLEVQQVFWDAQTMYIEADVVETLASYVSAGATLNEIGTQVHDPAAINSELRAFQEGAVAEMINTAPASVSDPEATIAELRGYLEDWRDFSVGELGLSDAPQAGSARLEAFNDQASDAVAPFVERIKERVFDPSRP